MNNCIKLIISRAFTEVITSAQMIIQIFYQGNWKRAFAGVGLLWKASFGDLVSPLSIDTDRIVGIQYACPKGDYLFFLAECFPSSNHSRLN